MDGARTGQHISSYVTTVDGPRQADDEDGPEEFHVVLLDNGRSDLLAGEFREALRCIRCGACQSVCPVYRSVGGHAYGWVYGGPIGAVLTPALIGHERAHDLPEASSFCGACEEICPVRIPLPALLRRWRERAYRSGLQPVRPRVALAVWGMAKTLTPDARRASIAVVAAVVALLLAGSIGQVLAIVLGAVAGLLLCRSAPAGIGDTGLMRFPVSRTAGVVSLVAFVVILLGMPILAALSSNGAVSLFDTFYRAGALVFGGGHVVLPLLQAGVVETGWVSPEQFLAGYGAVQAMPGPLFTFSAYLGTLSSVGPGGVLGAAIALVAIFLPGFLVLVGVLPFWNALRGRTWMQSLMRGANAAVVGILGAALYDPLFTTGIVGVGSFSLALVCFVLLIAWKLPPWAVVLIGGAGGILLAALGVS